MQEGDQDNFEDDRPRYVEETGGKPYNLELRTFEFAKEVRQMVKQLPRSATNFEDVKQVIRSSGSVGSNYIEANEALSKKDFQMRIRICRKEARESGYWLALLQTPENTNFSKQLTNLKEESKQLAMIFSSILSRSRGEV